MVDQMVLSTQKWLNKTYKNVQGFGSVPENGKTGWPTIYGLIRGFQHECGITELSDNFGPTTQKKADDLLPKLKIGYTGNLVYLIQGAFWCKGMSPEAFDGKYTTKTEEAISTLQKNAGVASNGKLTVALLKALFDMSAFVLVPGGDSKIRTMQQNLNASYQPYFGILPCDGIYQRETNSALIYALQAEIGMSPSEANGIYGPGTTSRTPVVNIGATGNVVKIIQWGLYVNGFYKSGDFNGIFSSSLGDEVISFRKFMKLPSYSATADMTVIKGLLSSAGNTSRDSIACDTSTQLSLEQIKYLKSIDFSVVGRYLTGSVGTGANKRNKYLTSEEIENLVNEGFSIFPIYQDGGWEENYFTSSQGKTDAILASNAAMELGFPTGATIYFAVDVDVLDGNIDSTVLPYIKAVHDTLSTISLYKTGIYGTRNVCQRAVDAGAVTNCFVSDMSTGFSGNLGFKMPKEWAFDQFIEMTVGRGDMLFPIDQVASSGRDAGVKNFDIDSSQKVNTISHNILNGLNLQDFFKEVIIVPNKIYEQHLGAIDLYLTARNTWSSDSKEGTAKIVVTNGIADMKVYLNPIQETLDKYNTIFKDVKSNSIESAINRLGPTVKNGIIETGLAARNGKIGTKIIVKSEYKIKRNGKTLTEKLELIIEIYVNQSNVAPIPVADYELVTKSVENNSMPEVFETIGGIAVVGLIIYLLPVEVIGIGSAAIASVFISILAWGKQLIS